jgi:Cellulase (glycosyl hydrolase family 5)
MVSSAPRLAVQGKHLTLDGKLFVPKGFALVAGEFMPPLCASWDCEMAYDALTVGTAELDALHEWGATTVRLSACQAVLTSSYADEYVARLKGLIDTLTARGLVVIVQMFDGKGEPCGHNNGNINQETVQAWSVLAPELAPYPTVMLETCNEPEWTPGPVGWEAWRRWNHKTIGVIRHSYLSPRPILVQGCSKGMTFKGLPGYLNDKCLVYTVHPYNYGHETWEQDFGRVAGVRPVLASEWYNTDEQLAQALVPRFLRYLTARNIGLIGWVFDSFSSQQLVSHNSHPPNALTAWNPAPPSGQQVHDYFTGATHD